MFVDPQLVDVDAGDLHLGTASPAIGAATPLAPSIAGSEDIDGSPRVSGAAADLGADEMACGNGVPDGDEQCDDGNLVSGDGCDVNCTVTACGNGIVTGVEACDDGNAMGGDCCSPLCAFEAADSACDDGEGCTFEDACDGDGSCGGSAAVESGCLLPDPGSAGSGLGLRGDGSDSDRLKWSWGKGPEALLGVFGDPVGGDDYRFCVFVDDGVSARVLVSAQAPGGAAWAQKGDTGLRYSQSDLVPDGLRQILLKSGEAGRAKIKIKGQSAALGIAGLGFGPAAAVSAELRNEATGACFAATYTAPFRSDEAGRFDDESD